MSCILCPFVSDVSFIWLSFGSAIASLLLTLSPALRPPLRPTSVAAARAARKAE
jgi:hypothetical protein